MSTKQARLVAAITAAMEAKMISQNELSRKTGISQGAISTAILGKYNPKEEKWRLICEALELDYDDIIADAEPSETAEAAAPYPEIGGDTAVPLSKEQEPEEDLVLNDEERRRHEVGLRPTSDSDCLQSQSEACDGRDVWRGPMMDVTARYLAGHLKEDVRKGMDISLEDLHTLLTVCKRMQDAAESK